MSRSWRKPIESDHFRKGRFFNLSHTPNFAPGVGFGKVLIEFFRRPAGVKPPGPIPSVKRDLKTADPQKTSLTWFGHSSYLIQSSGLNILVDPVFSGHASPFPWMIRSFPGSDIYQPEDFPEIDILLITHNHFDHLSSGTIKRLAPKVKACISSLGVGRDLAHYLEASTPITEMDWWENIVIADRIQLTATPARHFSGRNFQRNTSLWSGFMLETANHTLYLGGDSGFDGFYEEIAAKFPVIDLAILECGQYNTSWPYIHMMPEEVAETARVLGAKWILPVHWGKFALSNHPWDEPVKRLLVRAAALNIPVSTPRIGEALLIGHEYPQTQWWENIRPE